MITGHWIYHPAETLEKRKQVNVFTNRQAPRCLIHRRLISADVATLVALQHNSPTVRLHPQNGIGGYFPKEAKA